MDACYGRGDYTLRSQKFLGVCLPSYRCKNLISARFVYNLKGDKHGNPTRCRAQLVAQGYKQVEGLDYNFDDIFAPVARLKSVRAMCAIAAIEDDELVQTDIKSTFLYGRMEPREDVYLDLVPPKGIMLPGLKPGQTALKRVFAYLRGTQHYTLALGGNSSPILTGYCDSDGMSHPDRHPIAAYIFTIGGAISWSSKCQDIVCLSTTEAEYIAPTHAEKEAIWLHHLLDEVFPKRFKLPITVYSDNQGAIALSKDDRFHTRTKHIDIRFHFVRQYVEDGTLSITYLPTDRMLADALTKALAGPQITKLAGAIGLQTYKYQANCAFLVDMPAQPTWRYQQSTQSSRNASSPPLYNRRPCRRNIQTPLREDHPLIQHPTLPNRLPNTTRESVHRSTATTGLAYISISPIKVMCEIAYTALVIFTITSLIGMHIYVITQFVALMNCFLQDANLRHNEDYGWSTTTNNGSNNNNARGWGDSSAGWGTTNDNN
ncbi:hypothetical protein EW026_g6932 [Hermanssonia centrifuga]|uniref:Reverse transcriptase Ty1/copia-type domain-containing protein n=1 Tax=Hermanssonia centrifuga TaxID=98765 RepID=A0A4S4KDU6_9APHY|nr:hypothetical protein EW026_g6932 [Hermanssonia centrifuga]